MIVTEPDGYVLAYRSGTSELTEEVLREHLADEIADVAIYLDILAASEGIDLAAAIARKFNVTSEKVGFPERLRLAASDRAAAA